MASFLQWWYASPAPTDFSYEQERAQQMLLQNVKLKVALQQLKRQLVPATEVYRLGAELGAIRKMLTRLHRIAPSLEGLSEEVIEKRLKEQEEESLAQLGIMDERLKAWQAAAVEG